MPEIVRDLGQRYGDLGSVLVQHQGKLFVISGTSAWGYPEWIVVPANAHGAVTSWRDLGTGGTRDAALAVLEDTCHCGAPLAGSDHCIADGGCGCEQYERYCDEVYDPEPGDEPVIGYLSDEDLEDVIARLRAELEG